MSTNAILIIAVIGGLAYGVEKTANGCVWVGKKVVKVFRHHKPVK